MNILCRIILDKNYDVQFCMVDLAVLDRLVLLNIFLRYWYITDN